MKKHYYIIFGIIMFIAIVAISFYVKMGGFAKPEVSLKEYPASYIKGELYDGLIREKKFNQLFVKYAKLVNTKKVNGLLAAYYYNDPEKNGGKVKAIVGIIGSDTSQVEGNISQLIPAQKVIFTSVKAHFAVASNYYKATEEFAKKNKIKTKDEGVIEIYPSDNEVILVTPVEKKE